MDKEDVVHIHNGILLSHKKEQNWVIYRDVDGPRDHHTEWSKSERENKYHILTNTCDLEKWYRWSYFQRRDRDTGFPWWLSGKDSACQCWRHRFNPWSGKTRQITEQLSHVPNYWARPLEPGSRNYWSLNALEPVPSTKSSRCSKKPAHCN